MAERDSRYASVYGDYNRLSVEFLLADLDLALTLTEVARSHSDQSIFSRTIRSARKAYDTVLEKRSPFAISQMTQSSLIVGAEAWMNIARAASSGDLRFRHGRRIEICECFYWSARDWNAK